MSSRNAESKDLIDDRSHSKELIDRTLFTTLGSQGTSSKLKSSASEKKIEILNILKNKSQERLHEDTKKDVNSYGLGVVEKNFNKNNGICSSLEKPEKKK